MLIKRFKARNVFGYLNYDINFNEDINFLVGGNGSGKTSALRLINTLLTPNLVDILMIPFDMVELEIENSGEVIRISSVSDDENNKKLKINKVEEVLKIPHYSKNAYNYIRRILNNLDNLGLLGDTNFSDYPVINEILKIPSPVYIDLDRRQENYNVESYYNMMKSVYNNKYGDITESRMHSGGSVVESLLEVKNLVKKAYKKIREEEQRLSGKLKDQILLSAFHYTEISNDNLMINPNAMKEQKDFLLSSQKEVREILNKIDGKDSSLRKEIDKFFDQLSQLVNTQNESKDEIQLEWVLNKAQIDRMIKIVEIIRHHKTELDYLYKPINDFINTMNEFYGESGKELTVNALGEIIIIGKHSEDITVEYLSSGERQLLIIFAYTYLSNFTDKNNVFIIDEPELSLHLSWQEKFADMVFDIDSKSQFILATHSPEIVGEKKSKALECR